MTTKTYLHRKGNVDYMTSERRLAMALLNGGYMTAGEITRASGLPRSVVYYWARCADVDLSRARADFCRRQWSEQLKNPRWEMPQK